MQTLTIDKKAAQTLARAASRARAEKPTIRKTAERGVYLVESKSNPGHIYTVRCFSESKEITCSCPASKPCKHIAAVAPYHSFLISQEVAPALVETVKKPPLFCQNCNFRYATSPDGLCSSCRGYTPEMAAKDRSDLFG